MLANTLIEQAQAFVESDWREAEKLAKEAFDLNPGHPMAKTLRTLILDQKRETFVGECVSQARKLQTSGDLASAMSRVEEALSSYPREMRLMQIRDAVQRDLQTQRRQTRRRDLEELHRLESEADSATDADTKQTLGSKARALADKYLEDEEVVSSANGLLQKLNLPGITGKGISQDLISGATLSFAGEPTIDVAPQALQNHRPIVDAPASSSAACSSPAAGQQRICCDCQSDDTGVIVQQSRACSYAQTAKEPTEPKGFRRCRLGGIVVLGGDLVVSSTTQPGCAACAASRHRPTAFGRSIATTRIAGYSFGV